MAGVTPSAQPQQETGVVTQQGSLAPLVWRGTLLTTITLGFYRFWYRTDLRRWYSRGTSVGGDSFDFIGNARELLLGFVAAIVIIVPIYVAITVASVLVAETVSDQLTLGFILLLGFLAQYGAYRARRYRMTRTTWRGIRFNQDGSGWRYAGLSLVFGLITFVSAGLLFPLMRRALEKYRITHTRFASARGTFQTPLWPLIRRFLPLWLLFVGALGFAAHRFWLASLLPEGLAQTYFTQRAAIWLGIAVVSPLLLWPYYRAAEFKAFSNGTAIGQVSFRSTLSARKLYGQYTIFAITLAVLVFGGRELLIALGIYDDLSFDFLTNDTNLDMRSIIWLVSLYLIVFVLFSVANECILKQRFWRVASASLTVFNLESVAELEAVAPGTESAIGEGFADALDFGGA